MRLRLLGFVLFALLSVLPVHADGIEVYFSPGSSHDGTENSAIKTALINFLKSATKKIEIAVYNLQDRQIIEALNTIAAAGNVTIRVIVDDLNYPVATSDGTLALSSSITVKKDDNPNVEMHHKFIIVDRGESGAAVWAGSTNFNRPNLTTYNNNSILIRNSSVAGTFGTEFDYMWAGAFHTNKMTASTQTSFTVAGIPVEVRFAPRDQPMSKFISSVNAVTSSLYFAIFTYANTSLRDAMLNKKSTVQAASLGIFDKDQKDFNFTTVYGSFTSAGFNVMLDQNSTTMHHKFAVLDGLTVFTGSMNFTNAGNDENDENSIIIQDATIAKAYLAEMARLSGTSIGSITSADWKESISVGSGSSTPVSTAISEPTKDKAIAISYPNPFVVSQNSTITLQTSPEATLASVKIYSIDGRLLYTLTPTNSATKITWDGRTTRGEFLASGTYMMEMETKSSGIARGLLTLVR